MSASLLSLPLPLSQVEKGILDAADYTTEEAKLAAVMRHIGAEGKSALYDQLVSALTPHLFLPLPNRNRTRNHSSHVCLSPLSPTLSLSLSG